MVNAAGEGFNKRLPPDRTVAVALDLTKAFDSVDHCSLLNKVAATTLPNSLVRWLANYLHGRQIRTVFQENVSKARLLKVGTPQGSIISPHLFNFYVAELPEPPAPLKLVSYADDMTVFGTGKLEVVQAHINDYLPRLKASLDDLYLSISAPKSAATLLTKETQQIRHMERLVNVHIGGVRIPVSKNPKILGVTLDPQLRFHEHVSEVDKRVRRNNNVLKALSSTKEGQDKETLLATYKAIGRSLIDYAAPVWSTNASLTSFKKLQTAQNAALRIALGVPKMAHEDHLHTETKILKVQEHTEMLAAQYLAKCYDPQHACHDLSLAPDLAQFPRDKFCSITRKHREWVEAVMVWDPGGRIPDCRLAVKAIHTQAVSKSVNERGSNRVLGEKPPPVSSREKRFPRKIRCTLSQLRSGFSIFTNSYRSIISNVPDICPDCQGTPHDPVHLFNCPARRTVLTVRDLWMKPAATSNFLDLPGLMR